MLKVLSTTSILLSKDQITSAKLCLIPIFYPHRTIPNWPNLIMIVCKLKYEQNKKSRQNKKILPIQRQAEGQKHTKKTLIMSTMKNPPKTLGLRTTMGKILL